MNKLTNYLLIALLFTVFLPSSIALAVSGTAAITVNASIDNWTRILTVSGSISTGQGQQVTLKVINPSGQLDYLAQTASGAGGSFSFRYKLDENENGTYNVFRRDCRKYASENVSGLYGSDYIGKNNGGSKKLNH